MGFGLIFTSALTKAGYDLAHSSMDVGSLFFQSRWISAYAFKLFRKREAQEKLSMTNERYTATIKEAQEALAELETEREGFKTGAALPRAGTVG